MAMNLIKSIKLSNEVPKCSNPNCRGELRLSTNPNVVIAYVTLLSRTNEYKYCSQKCFEDVLGEASHSQEKIGIEGLKVSSVKLLGDCPKRYRVLCEMIDFKLMG